MQAVTYFSHRSIVTGAFKRSFATAAGVFFLQLCATALAQTDAHLLLDDWTAGKHVEAQSDAQLFPRSSIGGGESSQFNRIDSKLRARLDPTLPLSPGIGVDWTHIELSSGTRLPSQLDDLSLAVGAPLYSDGQWFGGGAIGAGYAGDDAFAANHSWYAKANAFVGRDMGRGRTLLFALDYDGNRSLLPDIPLPSVEYDWKVSDELEVAAGFPTTAAEWKPTPKLSLSAEYDFPITVVLAAQYQLLPRLAAQLRYLSDDDSFHARNLGEDRRIFYEDQRIELGLITTLFEDWKIDSALGYAWDRKFSEGFDDRDSDTVADLNDQVYLRLGLEFDF